MPESNGKQSQERPSAEPAWPKSEEALIAYIREMARWPASSIDAGEGYGRCVYAVAYAAVATFNYMASMLGITGFQASCADLEILKQTRGLKHGFMIVDAGNLLYPQYDVAGRVYEWIEKTRPQLADVAKKLIEQDSGHTAAPRVRERWEEIARLVPNETEG